MTVNMKNLRYRHPVRYARMLVRAHRMVVHRQHQAEEALASELLEDIRAEERSNAARERAIAIQKAWADAARREAAAEEKRKREQDFFLTALAVMALSHEGTAAGMYGLRF
ncbi:MAG: hypothetical protein KDK34_18630 [Leptospiraceae bacterium]|nr:hypothetical protein [Leptospiraceae bacterium]